MINNIKYFSTLLLIIFVSCQKNNYDSTNPVYSEGGLISFSTKVETKAPIIESLKGRNFGVYGFKYSANTDWSTAKTKATPNTFMNQFVTCSTSGACSYEYTPIIVDGNNINADLILESKKLEWELSRRYSFFAYFPYDGESNSCIVSSGLTYQDKNEEPQPNYEVPYIEYTMPAVGDDGYIDGSELLDIMTAKKIDHTVSNGTEVRFSFNHRLFCIDLYGHNFVEDVTISNLSVTISGIRYNKSKIYLDKDRKVYDESLKQEVPASSEPSTANNWDPNSQIKFKLLGQNESVDITKDESSKSIIDNKIMLIPQDSSKGKGLTFTIQFDKTTIVGEESVTKTVTVSSEEFNINFQEGVKYDLTLNFISDSVTLIDVTTSDWENKDVNHTFQ